MWVTFEVSISIYILSALNPFWKLNTSVFSAWVTTIHSPLTLRSMIGPTNYALATTVFLRSSQMQSLVEGNSELVPGPTRKKMFEFW